MLDSDTLARMPDIDFRALAAAVHTEQVRRAGAELADAILALVRAEGYNPLEAALLVLAPVTPGSPPTVTSLDGDTDGITLWRVGSFAATRTERIDVAVERYLQLRPELAESDIRMDIRLVHRTVTCQGVRPEAVTA